MVIFNLSVVESRPLWPISTKHGTVVRVDDVTIQFNFGFNILRGFRSIGGQNFHFPIDFAGHHYNSTAATAISWVMFRIHRIYTNLKILGRFKGQLSAVAPWRRLWILTVTHCRRVVIVCFHCCALGHNFLAVGTFCTCCTSTYVYAVNCARWQFANPLNKAN